MMVLRRTVRFLFGSMAAKWIAESVLSAARTVLKYLDEQDIKATFFVVGSRVIESPDILVEVRETWHGYVVHAANTTC